MRGIGNKNIQETKSDFSTKFDRLYATQKYIAAFDLCIQNVKTSSIEEVQKKAELVIPKLKGNLELSNVDKFTYDDIVDIFIGTKHKMKMKNGKLKISYSLVEIRKEYSLPLDSSYTSDNLIKHYNYILNVLFRCPYI